MSKRKQPVVLAVVGDTHAGSTRGLCPREGVMLPDSGRYHPSPTQLWLAENWLDYWAKVAQLAKRHKARVVGLHLGDSVEGGLGTKQAHRTTQVITNDPEAQAYIRDHSLLPMRKACGTIYVCRGTEAHIGSGADDAAGKHLGAVRHPDTDMWAATEWEIWTNGVLHQARHHWSMGGLPWTEHGAAVRLAHQLLGEYAAHAYRKGVPPVYPQLVWRGHMHRFADSGPAQPIRVLGCGAWQVGTQWVEQKRQTSLTDVGGWIVVCSDGAYELHKVAYTPERSTAVVA